MRNFFSAAPGLIWAAIILFLVLFADWLTTHFGAEAWVAPVAGFLLLLVPVLRLIAQGEEPAGAVRGELGVPRRSKLSRFFL